MDYQELFLEENEAVMERFELSMERITSMHGENTVGEPYLDFFRKASGFILTVGEFLGVRLDGGFRQASLKMWQEWNHRLYEDVLPGHYEASYANPAYAVSMLGDRYGQLLSFLYKEIRGDIIFAHECRLTDITILNEVFIEIYNMFEDEVPDAAAIQDVLYWFVSDYTDYTVTYRVRESLDPRLSFAADIIRTADFSDLSYLYRLGEYISESELQTAAYINGLPEETVRLMADTYTEGYRKGFGVMGRDITKKSIVQIRYEAGFERMVKYAMENFKKAGLAPVVCRSAVWAVNSLPGKKVGYHSSSPNQQYEYDHRYDDAIFLTKAFKERKNAVLRVAYDNCKNEAAAYAGPAVIETFGQDSFVPVNKPEALSLDEKQMKLAAELANETSRIVNEYVPGDETSFTIIAFPVPAIGKDFEGIFNETIAINTLDYEKYKVIQQTIIDTLDEAQYVTVRGKGSNRTDLRVSLHKLSDKTRQTNFENCVADVNIPLGEVFTSPALSGTSGTLFVGTVYIGEIQFKNLYMIFENGMVKEYGCDNFADPREGKALIKQLILKNHDTVPMGEFAIGTNTTAYAMAQKYGILHKLPILIVEKMGPHFAVGDTCYSWAEDSPVFNPDGKEIIARDNEVSILRKEDVSRAYFSCHTDITIPYSELDTVCVVREDGTKAAVIENGCFVLKGTEELNDALKSQL